MSVDEREKKTQVNLGQSMSVRTLHRAEKLRGETREGVNVFFLSSRFV